MVVEASLVALVAIAVVAVVRFASDRDVIEQWRCFPSHVLGSERWEFGGDGFLEDLEVFLEILYLLDSSPVVSTH